MSYRCYVTLRERSSEGYSPSGITALLGRRRTLSHRIPLARTEIYHYHQEHQRRFSISGYQTKLSLCHQDGRFFPVESGGTHLLKPAPLGVAFDLAEDVPANEHVCMLAARTIFRVPTAAAGLVRLADETLAYVTRRFDRRDAQQSRIPQEDFAQLLGYPSKAKYDGSYQEIGEAIAKHCVAPQAQLLRFFRLLLANFLLGNGDLHCKNLSLYAPQPMRYELTPAYDIVCTSVHIPQDSRLGLSLFPDDPPGSGPETVGCETARDFLLLAERLSLPSAAASRALREAQTAIPRVHALVDRSYLSTTAKERFHATLADRLQALRLLS
jgi:serine/threonine-protein kinase HipA